MGESRRTANLLAERSKKRNRKLLRNREIGTASPRTQPFILVTIKLWMSGNGPNGHTLGPLRQCNPTDWENFRRL